MENKNTKELRGYKAGLKSKLMGAVAMLLVSAIMVSSATYAWFVLSTHPEVKGMSTTVGSNGALEIALLNNETGKADGLANITAAVGDSKLDVTRSNETWGNIVDLSNEAYYGLNLVELYPARPTWLDNAGTTAQLKGHNTLLSYAKYGTDGRIEMLADTVAGTKNGDANFVGSADAYGVRAIGTSTNQAPEAAKLDTAMTSYGAALKLAESTANSALANNGEKLGGVPIARAIAKGTDAKVPTYTQDDVNAIKSAMESLQAAANSIEDALKWALVAKSANGDVSVDAILNYSDIDFSNTTYSEDALVKDAYSKLTEFRNAVTAGLAKIPAEQTSYEWDTIRDAYSALVDYTTMDVGGKTMTQLEAMGKDAAIEWALGAAGSGVAVTVSNGLFSDMANFIGQMKTGTFTYAYGKLGIKYSLTANRSDSTLTDDATYMVPITTAVGTYKYTGAGSAKTYITNRYGYIVDLAFQTNINGDLQLQETGTKRVSSDTTTATQGGGTYYTVTTTNPDTKALSAIRIAFIDSTNTIIAVGKVDTTANVTDGKYPVHIYKFSKVDGKLNVTDEKVDNDTITTLEANKPVAISALVYLDGDSTSYAQGGITGMLNLQFKHSAGDLSPMNYDFSAATGGATGNEEP